MQPYAERIKRRVRAAAADAVIHEGFMNPERLATVYQRTRLNVHPPLYDAFGMTVVEAGAFGVSHPDPQPPTWSHPHEGRLW